MLVVVTDIFEEPSSFNTDMYATQGKQMRGTSFQSFTLFHEEMTTL